MPVPGRPVILLLNSGAIPHIGPHRLYVNMARRWAALGFPVFRCDIGSIGDSDANRGWDLDGLYSDDTLKEIKTAISFLHHHTGCDQFVLSGVCLGAYASFQLALRDLLEKGLTIKGGMLINPYETTHPKRLTGCDCLCGQSHFILALYDLCSTT